MITEQVPRAWGGQWRILRVTWRTIVCKGLPHCPQQPCLPSLAHMSYGSALVLCV